MDALIVVDMQWGIFNKSTKVFEGNLLIENINRLIDHFHNKHYPVIFLRFTGEFLLMKDTKDWSLLPEIHYQSGDPVIDKLKSDAFSEAAFTRILELLKIERIYITGVIFHGCVQSTVYGAVNAGMPVTLISDGHSNFSKKPDFIIQSVNMRILNDGIELLTTNEVIGVI